MPGQPQQILEARAHVPEHVVHRRFDAETVLLNLRTGQYHGLNATGGRFLELVADGCAPLRDCAERLAAEYERDPAEVSADLVELCEALAARGLIEVEDAGRG